jgi:hypothetical protein
VTATVVVERSGYGDWSALASRVGSARRLVGTALTNAGSLQCASSMRQRPEEGRPRAVIEQHTQPSTGRHVRR